jgi:hypothetical protein
VKDIREEDAVITDIVSLIVRSQVVISDLTDRNANVFMRRASHTGSAGRDPPSEDKVDTFGLQHLRHAHYENTRERLQALSKTLGRRLKTLHQE